MQPSETLPAGSQTSNERPTRERVGLALDETEAAAAVEHMRAAEVAGVRQVWMNQTPTAPDTLTVLAAAAVRTTTIPLGTAGLAPPPPPPPPPAPPAPAPLFPAPPPARPGGRARPPPF